MAGQKEGIETLGDTKVDRRKLLAVGAVTALGAGISALLPEEAEAAGLNPVELGQVNKTGSLTTIHNDSEGQNALLCKAGGFTTDDGHIGIEGEVLRDVYAPNQPGFYPTGVMGRVTSTVGGPSQAGVGVQGFSGVGPTTGPQGAGVRGVGNQIGVRAESTRRALDVEGKAYFSSAGTGYISSGAAQKTIYGVVADKNAVILVTLQGPAGKNVSVRYVNRRSATSFTVYLTGKAAKKVKFGWFIVN